MYIDPSRAYDINFLQAGLKDPSVPKIYKGKAYESLRKIHRELKDPTLNKLRRMLIKAGDAEDKDAQWKISQQMKAHIKEEQLEKGTY